MLTNNLQNKNKKEMVLLKKLLATLVSDLYPVYILILVIFNLRR